MIKVLIAEDETPAARAIARLVGNYPGFSVSGTVTNGAEALDFLRTHPVDLLITDVCMPVMTGLDLLEALRREFPQCLGVVLSGYSDFSYAKTAMHHHAFDYLLKPINRNDLYDLLKRIADTIAARDCADQHTRYEQALSGEAVAADQDDHVFCCLVYAIHAEHTPSIWKHPEHSPLIQHIFADSCHIFRGALPDERILLLENHTEAPESLQRYYQELTRLSDAPIHMICFDKSVPLSSLSRSVLQLRWMLEQKMRLFFSDFFLETQTDHLSHSHTVPLRETRPEQAVEAICAQERRTLISCLSQMLNMTEAGNSLYRNAQCYLDTLLCDTRIAYQMPPDMRKQLHQAMTATLLLAATPDTCAADLADMLLSWQKSAMGKCSAAEVVEAIVHHLQANYHLPFSVDALARQYGFSPSHLNRIFKKHKGVRPAEYLLTLRMNRARHMLETNPDMLVRDVANSVGYSDHHYFSNLFKKETGFWPTEYQKQAQETN